MIRRPIFRIRSGLPGSPTHRAPARPAPPFQAWAGRRRDAAQTMARPLFVIVVMFALYASLACCIVMQTGLFP